MKLAPDATPADVFGAGYRKGIQAARDAARACAKDCSEAGEEHGAIILQVFAAGLAAALTSPTGED